MMRTTIFLPEDIHRGMKMMADATIRDYRKNPKSATSLEDYLAKRR